MKISYQWLQGYFAKKLPAPEALAERVNFSFAEVESIEKRGADFIFDIKILPDRACYALSHRGVAREIGAFLGWETKEKEVHIPKAARKTRTIVVRVEDKTFCPRYTARVIEGVAVGASPSWLRERLEAIGERSINNVVDITNYVMFDMGQPLHAFDADTVQGSITVRRARMGEKLTTLDGKELTLSPDQRVIADDAGPLALAGVKGGSRAGVTMNTRAIIVEAASFEAGGVRRASQASNIKTESSRRFENNSSPWLAGEGSEACAARIRELCPSARCGSWVDIFPKKPKPKMIRVPTAFIRAALGMEIGEKEIISVLRALRLRVQKAGGVLAVTPPPERRDLGAREDIVEEVGRMVGYDKIPETILPPTDVPAEQTDCRELENRVRALLVAEGFSEVLTSSFAAKGSVAIEKPLASDKAYGRADLYTNFYPALLKNFGNAPLLGTDTVRQFEIGSVFTPQGERRALIFGALGAKQSVRSVVRKLEQAMGRTLAGKFCGGENVYETSLPPPSAGYSPQGEIREESPLEGGARRAGDVRFRPFSPYPFMVRDVAFFVPQELDEKRAREIIEGELRGKEMHSVRLFDSFEKEGQHSLAFRIVFQSMARTFTDAEANTAMEGVYRVLRSRGCIVR